MKIGLNTDCVGQLPLNKTLDLAAELGPGADPIPAIEALGEAIYHVHAKDTRLEPFRQVLTSRPETGAIAAFARYMRIDEPIVPVSQ